MKTVLKFWLKSRKKKEVLTTGTWGFIWYIAIFEEADKIERGESENVLNIVTNTSYICLDYSVLAVCRPLISHGL